MAIGFAIMSGIGAWWINCTSAPAQETSTDRVRELQEKRLEVLVRIYEKLQARYDQGSNEYRECAAAQMAMFQAKLDLAKTKAERIKIREEMVIAGEKWVRAVKICHAGDPPVGQVSLRKSEIDSIVRRIAALGISNSIGTREVDALTARSNSTRIRSRSDAFGERSLELSDAITANGRGRDEFDAR